MNTFENPKTFIAITPSNSTILDPVALFVGNGGNLRVTSVYNSSTVTFINVASGTFLPVVVKKVWSASTTCTNIIGLK